MTNIKQQNLYGIINTLQVGDVLLTHSKFGLFSLIINGTDYLLYKLKCLAKIILQSVNADITLAPFFKVDHIARIGDIRKAKDGTILSFTIYETVAINKQCKFFSFKRWRGGTIKTRITSKQDLEKHYKHKKIYLKQLGFDLTKIQKNAMFQDLENQVAKTKQGLTKYTWKYVFLSPFDIFLSAKKRPNKDTITHINYCQMLIQKNNIAAGLESDFTNTKEILQSPLQEISKPFYKKDIFQII